MKFRVAGNVGKKHKGPAKIVRTPRRPACKHVAAPGISDRTVRRILHEELRLHPHKISVVLQLTERDFNARQTVCESPLEDLPSDALVLFSA